MLVVNERVDAPYSEKVVAGWLRSCNVPGIAVAGGFVPGRGRGARGQEADFIVFTPNTCVCIEVKGTLSRTGGELSCPVNGRWTMPGFTGDPVHVRAGDVNPLSQARSAMFSLKSITASVTGSEQFVSALVVVVPLGGTVVSLNKAPKRFMPKGVDVVLGARPHELFAWFQRGKFRASVWTVERVRGMLDALGVNDPATDWSSLAGEGFPATATATTSTVSAVSDDDDPFTSDSDPFAPTPSASPSTDSAVESSASTRTRSTYEDHYNAWRPSYTPPGYRPPSVPAPPGQRPPCPPGNRATSTPASRARQVGVACRGRVGGGGGRHLVHRRCPPQTRFHQPPACHLGDRATGRACARGRSGTGADSADHRPAVLPAGTGLLRPAQAATDGSRGATTFDVDRRRHRRNRRCPVQMGYGRARNR